MATPWLKGYDSILDQDIDFVSIATESGYHYQVIVDFLNAGKHVLVEKPMALDTDHLEHMFTLSRDKGLKLGVCFEGYVEGLRVVCSQWYISRFSDIFSEWIWLLKSIAPDTFSMTLPSI